jgi:hypothetical protein
MEHDALLFQFENDEKARLAGDTLQELGYEPQIHEGGRVHIHVRREDLVSALEIVQACGGQMIERADADVVTISNDAYGMDCIQIPAHTVNEDWEEGYPSHQTLETEPATFHPDDGSYDHFEAR